MHTPSPFALKPLALALCLAGLPAAAAESAGGADDAKLNTISVIGSRERAFTADTVQLGAFRDQTALDTPLTVQVVTRELLDAQAATTLFDAVKNSAGVTRVQLGGAAYDNLAVRGIPAENRGNFRLNGALPVINLIEMPVENKARIEVLKGVSALYYGFVSPAGIVNMVNARAGGKPVATVELRGDDKGGWNVHTDLGRRFGETGAFGARVNLSDGRVELGAPGYEGKRRFASAALDWRATDALSFKLDLERIEKDIPEPAAIAILAPVAGRITLPNLPDPDVALTNPDWQRTRANAEHALLRADWALNDRWLATLEIGRAETSRDRVFSTFQNYNLATGEGSLSVALNRGQEYTNDNLRAELAGLVATGSIDHELTFGYTRNERWQGGPVGRTVTIAQNLYAPRAIAGRQVADPTAFNPSTITDEGAYVLDRVRLGDVQILAGLRRSDYENVSNTARYATRDTTPSLGAIWTVAPKLNLYASYIEGLEEGGTAPVSAANSGEIMPPATSEQVEVGIKGDLGAWQFAAGLFRIDRAQAYTNAANVYVLDGRVDYKGWSCRWPARSCRAPRCTPPPCCWTPSSVKRPTRPSAASGRRTHRRRPPACSSSTSRPQWRAWRSTSAPSIPATARSTC